MTRRKDGKSPPTGTQDPERTPTLLDAFRKARLGEPADLQGRQKKLEGRIKELIKGLDGDFVGSHICAEELKSIGAPAIPALIDRLGHDEDAHVTASELIREIGVDDAQFKALTDLVRDKAIPKTIRTNAAYVLSKMKDRETMGILTENLADDEIGKEIAAYLAWGFGVKAFPQIAEAFEKGVIDQEGLEEFTGYLKRDLKEQPLGDIHELLICGKTDLERKWAAHALIELGEEPVPAVEKAHLGDTYELLSWCLGRLGLDSQQKMGIVDIINSLRGYKKPE